MAIVVQGLDLDNFAVHPLIPAPAPSWDLSQSGGVVANQYPFKTLVFQEAVLSAAYWQFTTGTVGAGITQASIAIDWFLASGNTTGNVRWGVQIASIGATLSIVTKALGAVVNASGGASGTAFGVVRTTLLATDATFTQGNAPLSVALKVFRAGDDVLDTAVGDVKVRRITVLYQDT